MKCLKTEILNIAYDLKDIFVKDRRFFHQNPELSYKEFNTSAYVKNVLDELGIPYKDGYGITGILAEIEGEKTAEDKNVILFRGDMDALPVTECSDKEYASNAEGVMHACGHDAHTAILLGLCRVLSKIKDKFSGTVKFCFQPAEELDGGADSFINNRALENPDVDICLALHVDPEIDAGKVRIKSGSLYASPDDFYIKIIGKGGHGAERFNCIDPILISGKVIEEIINIPEKYNDTEEDAVVSVGTVCGGTATNIIPDYVEISGTARSLSTNVRNLLKTKIEEVTKSICDMYGASYEYEFKELSPPLVNDPDLAEALLKSAKESLGADNVIKGGSYTMAGEDFACFAINKPSVMVKLGCRNEEKGIINSIHNPMFDIDEECLLTGVKMFAYFAVDFLN